MYTFIEKLVASIRIPVSSLCSFFFAKSKVQTMFIVTESLRLLRWILFNEYKESEVQAVNTAKYKFLQISLGMSS